MKIEITREMERSLLRAAQEACTGRAHNPEIAYDCEAGLFAYGSALVRTGEEVEFVGEFALVGFLENWFGPRSAPSRYRLTDARHCLRECVEGLEDYINELETV